MKLFNEIPDSIIDPFALALLFTAFFGTMGALTYQYANDVKKSIPPNLPERPYIHEEQCPIDHHEYQIELEFDTVLIYDNNRFVGSYIVQEPLSPIDSILADDNR